MKILNNKILCASMLAAFVVTANAQTAIGPFFTPQQERFDTLASGAYVGFVGFSGQAAFNRIGSINAMQVGPASLLPPISAPHAMFGRGCDVQIRWQQPKFRFGGGFRLPLFAPGTNAMRVEFFFAGSPIGTPVVVPVTNVWTWRGWQTSGFAFDEVRIFGLGGSLPGYVGMDNLRVQ